MEPEKNLRHGRSTAITGADAAAQVPQKVT
jgi:hypothetical protein